MLTERTVVGKIEVLENGVIQVRDDIVIERDGAELIRIPHRRVLEPKADTSDLSGRLKSIADVVWTPQVISDRQKEIGTIAVTNPAIR